MTQSAKNKFGKMLYNERIKNGLTQLECAKKFGVSIVSFQNWERGVCAPRKDKFEIALEFIGASTEDFQ